jgi:dihydrofolate synthase/folylpolyglutamate synthase
MPESHYRTRQQCSDVLYLHFSMDYRQSITYLFSLQRFGIKLGLKNIQTLLSLLDNPHKKLRCVHIAGTNGKGSTAAFLHSILKYSGFRAGLFTSPHLVNFTERIRINDAEIGRKRVVQLVRLIRHICRQNGLENITFFEFITALAFTYFAAEAADPVIIETGMGGRLDATNVIHPLVTVITSISTDHQFYLGNTINAIAGEKAGIIKKNTPLVTGARQPMVLKLFSEKCKKLHAPLYVLGRDIQCRRTGTAALNYRGLDTDVLHVQPGLAGDHQLRNAGLALGAAELLQRQGLSVSQEAMRIGLQQACWPGRLEVVQQHPSIVLDGAHNPEAWTALRKALQKYFLCNRLFMVIGIMRDKDIARMIETLTPDAHTVIFCKPKMDRAAGEKDIARFAEEIPAKKVLWIDDTAAAIRKARALARPDDLICVTGSLFAVGEAREELLPGRLQTNGRIPM